MRLPDYPKADKFWVGVSQQSDSAWTKHKGMLKVLYCRAHQTSCHCASCNSWRVGYILENNATVSVRADDNDNLNLWSFGKFVDFVFTTVLCRTFHYLRHCRSILRFCHHMFKFVACDKAVCAKRQTWKMGRNGIQMCDKSLKIWNHIGFRRTNAKSCH